MKTVNWTCRSWWRKKKERDRKKKTGPLRFLIQRNTLFSLTLSLPEVTTVGRSQTLVEY